MHERILLHVDEFKALVRFAVVVEGCVQARLVFGMPSAIAFF